MIILEILFLIYITREITKSVAMTDRQPRKYVNLAIICWIIGEVCGIIIGLLLGASPWIAYLVGILGGIVGILIVFAIVGNLPESEAKRAAIETEITQPISESERSKDQTEIESLYVIGGFIGVFGMTILAAVFFLNARLEQVTSLISAIILLAISVVCIVVGAHKKRAQAE